MIHNLNEYLSDEQLQSLISEVEEKEMLRAPGHLKENVFERIKVQKRTARRRREFSYRAKVLAGMAAAMAVLIMIPARDIDRESVPIAQLFNIGQEEPESEPLQKMEQERTKDSENKWQSYMESKERKKSRRAFKEGVSEWVSSLGDAFWNTVNNGAIDGNTLHAE